jgi:hypothetical protein
MMMRTEAKDALLASYVSSRPQYSRHSFTFFVLPSINNNGDDNNDNNKWVMGRYMNGWIHSTSHNTGRNSVLHFIYLMIII